MEARLMAFLGIATVITVILGPDFDLVARVVFGQGRGFLGHFLVLLRTQSMGQNEMRISEYYKALQRERALRADVPASHRQPGSFSEPRPRRACRRSSECCV